MTLRTGLYTVNPRRLRICFCKSGGSFQEPIMNNIFGRMGSSSGGGCCCSGGWWPSFRNGLLFGAGFGIANGIMNWLSGGWKRACNCFSTWGCGGGFGFSPMPIGSNWSFGGCGNFGFNWINPWNNNANNNKTNTENKEKKKDKSQKTKTSESQNADNPSATGNAGTGKKAQASENDDTNTAQVPRQATAQSGNSSTRTADESSESKIKIGDKEVDLSALNSVDAVNEIKSDDLAKISQEDAKKILKQLGVKENESIKYPNSINVLKLVEKAEIPVKMAHTTGEKIRDEYITGKLSAVEFKDSLISYTINCSGVGTQGNTYNVTQDKDKKNKFTFKVTPANGVKLANDDIDTAKYTYTEDKKLLERSGDPLTIAEISS